MGEGSAGESFSSRDPLRALISCALVRQEDGRQGIPLSLRLLAIQLNRKGASCPPKGEVSGAEKIFDDIQSI